MFPYQDKLHPWSSHSILARWLKDTPAGSKVVDIGTASGTLGRLCQGRGFELFGIEPNLEWAEAARPYYQEIVIGLVQAAPVDLLAGARVIVLADVLEHLPEPQAVLNDLVARAAPGCIFMISVPNVANLSVRLGLLFGLFDYTDRGILDRTHLHFFTRATYHQMLAQAGLKIQRSAVTPVPLNFVHPFFEEKPFGRWIHHALAVVTTGFPTLLGYQFVVQAVKQ